jgi:hypothetical protein
MPGYFEFFVGVNDGTQCHKTLYEGVTTAKHVAMYYYLK